MVRMTRRSVTTKVTFTELGRSPGSTSKRISSNRPGVPQRHEVAAQSFLIVDIAGLGHHDGLESLGWHAARATNLHRIDEQLPGLGLRRRRRLRFDRRVLDRLLSLWSSRRVLKSDSAGRAGVCAGGVWPGGVCGGVCAGGV